MKTKLILFLLLTCGLLRSVSADDAVTIGTSTGARQPQLAIDARGGVHLTFGAEGAIYYTFSSDSGKSYAEPVRVARLKALSLGMRRGPRIAVTKQAILISAIGGALGGGKDGDLFAWRSTDNGKSWQGPAQVNDTTASAREGLHAMAAGPNGDAFCVWLDLREKRTQLFGARSTDGGQTWSPNVLVYESPDGSICQCCHPSVVYDDRAGLHVLWRNSLAGNRDMFWASSTDGGHTFAEAIKLGEGTWPLDACPMDGGAIAIASNGQPAAVWRRDQEIFLTNTIDAQEQKLGRGLQPWLAANDQGLYTVWLSARPGDLYLMAAGHDEPAKLASHARDPVVAAKSNGPAIVAWESDEDGHPMIKAMTIPRSTN